MFPVRRDDVEYEPGERVREFIERRKSEAQCDETVEQFVGVEAADDGVVGDAVPGDEGVAALEGLPARMAVRQFNVHRDVVDVDRFGVEVRPGRDGRALATQRVAQ